MANEKTKNNDDKPDKPEKPKEPPYYKPGEGIKSTFQIVETPGTKSERKTSQRSRGV
jgi:hypothetical protein